MKKRRIVVLSALVLSVGILGGCSGNVSAADTTAVQETVSVQETVPEQDAETNEGGYTGNQVELAEMLDHFGDQEFIDANLSVKKQQLSILATLVTTMSYPQVKEQVGIALDAGLTPIEIKEAIYQVAPYAGYQKAINAMAYADEMFEERGIELPLESQATVTDENRYEEGLAAQRAIFGENFAAITDDMSESMKRRVAYVSEYSFGDFMTRTGLDDAERELIVTCTIAALGGADSQLSGHAAGSLTAGNTGDELLASVLLCAPYNGFPRALNAYGIINEVVAQAE